MPVPATIADLNTDEALNSPSDADTITPTTRPSDYLRAHAAIIKQHEANLAAATGANLIGVSSSKTVYDVLKNNRLDLVEVGISTAAAPTVAVNVAAGNLNGLTRYFITYVTAVGESEVGTMSAEVTPANQQVDLSSIPVSADAAVTARKIYRTPVGVADPVLGKLVATISDNTTTTYTDNIADASLGVACPRLSTTGGAIYRNGVRVMQLGGLTTAIGLDAHPSNTGYSNTAIGGHCMSANTTGYRNTATGDFALYSNTTGARNSAFGVHALNYAVTADDNTAFGYAAAMNITGANNTSIGSNALVSGTTASGTTAVGSSAMLFTTTGVNNSAFGFGSMLSNTTGQQNTAVGSDSLRTNVSGHFNTAVGTNAGNFLTSSSNVAIGFGALYTCSAGGGNVAIGPQAGYYETGSNTLFIDNQPRASEADARTKALIYGVFGVDHPSQSILINGALTAATGFGCNGKTAQSAVTVNAACTDLATAVALVNQLRAALIANGICV